jgi:UDP-N-acetylmuramyl tripeptide synthase
MAELVDSRRITGASPLGDLPGAVIDVRLDEAEATSLIARWQTEIRHLLDAVGWTGSAISVRRVAGGASLAFDAPIDTLYAATELNELAWQRATTPTQDTGSDDPALARVKSAIADESKPMLLALADGAADADVPMLSDDDAVSLGLGCHSRTWPIAEIPDPAQVEWSGLARIPVGLVTGTNGKTTTVRLSAAIARAGGHRVGLSTTDGIWVDDERLDSGDYSGPGGARAVLRDPRVTLAVLETARGGLQRRGLGVARAEAALITNIAADHLGEFGVGNLDELAEIKWVVSRAVSESGVLILNAEDPILRKLAATWDRPLHWFCMHGDDPFFRTYVGSGGSGTALEDSHIVRYENGEKVEVIDCRQIPLTLGGAAAHNVANALAATALCSALGIDDDAIRRGLSRMQPNDNRGRLNVFNLRGATVIVDFAHNPHGVAAIADLANALPSRRRLLVMGQAGDRSDVAMRDLATAAWEVHPDRILLKEMAEYARGRAPGEVVSILRDALLAAGADESCIEVTADESTAIDVALEWLQPGDLVILLVHENAARAVARVRRACEEESE